LITSPFTPEQLSQVLIVGNASGEWQPLKRGLSFIFNGTLFDASVVEGSLYQGSLCEGTLVDGAAAESGALASAGPSDAPSYDSADAAIINIANGGFAAADAAFVVQSSRLTQQQCEAFSQQLLTMAKQLAQRLNCWPSSGLTCFALLSQLAPVQVSRMSLLPSLYRDPTMTPEQHLPCVVHNWLGERRIALEIFSQAPANNDEPRHDASQNGTKKHAIHWPELVLEEQRTHTAAHSSTGISSEDSSFANSPFIASAFTNSAFTNSAFTNSAFTNSAFTNSAFTNNALTNSAFLPSDDMQSSPFALLHQIATRAPSSHADVQKSDFQTSGFRTGGYRTKEYQTALNQLAGLSQLDSQQWQGKLNPIELQQALIDVEALFVDQSLQQHPIMRPDNIESHSRYWYLADNTASQYLDAIRQQLALCQQALTLA
jgi:hypothetical protein